MRYIDLRSDTVTVPTKEMRDAMYAAAVGDDVYRDDPTVAELEELAAQMLGKEAALFVPSGTMGNQLCVMTHTKRGDEIMAPFHSHIIYHEVSAVAVLSGLMVCPVTFRDGIPDSKGFEKHFRDKNNIHNCHTGLISYENATSAGRVVPIENMRRIYATAKKYNVPVHIDGARLFNAAVSLGVDIKELTCYCDTVMVCISKGLCAPIGSLIAGSGEFIETARHNRKLLGGGLRQAGILAAPGILALKEMTKRLSDDHDNAKYLAKKLSEIPLVKINTETIDINMIFFDVKLPIAEIRSLPQRLLEKGIKINDYSAGEGFRFVTHNDVTREDVDFVAQTLKKMIY